MTPEERLKDIADQMTEEVCKLASGECTRAEVQFRFNGLRAEAERLHGTERHHFAKDKP